MEISRKVCEIDMINIELFLQSFQVTTVLIIYLTNEYGKGTATLTSF